MENKAQVKNLRVGAGKFLYGEGALARLTGEIIRLGGKPLVLGGETAVGLLQKHCGEEWVKNSVEPVVIKHAGACSRGFATKYSEMAKAMGCTLILGVGGGKVIDLAKCAATFGGLDLICVPTSVATCVASSSVCIMYNDDGTPDGSVAMEKEVDVVIADTLLISTAPRRTLAAGILDSMAKLPEVVHNIRINSYRDCSLEKYICTVNSKAIYEFLMGEARNVYDSGLASGRLTDVILTTLLHTSVVSGFSSGVNQLALAHGLYDFMRRSFTKEAADIMHGELVAVGIIMQLYFNGAADEEVEALRSLMEYMNMPLSLRAVGLEPNEENIKQLIAYLIPSTALKADDIPKLQTAIAKIAY